MHSRKDTKDTIKDIPIKTLLLDPIYSWFKENKRDLIFRKNRNSYHVYVSEIMLQQTRVRAMLKIYKQFIEKFPTLESLAQAHREDVLQAWSGLGYYRRAIHLHEGAKQICRDYPNACFPENYSDALSIQGIGPYTAAAVLSICYEKKHAVLDGNVARIYMRLYALSGTAERNMKSLRIISQEHIQTSPERPSLHNESLMELGAMICLPKGPLCHICPLKNQCLGHQKHKEEVGILIPLKKKLQRNNLELKIYLLRNKNKEILILKENNSRFFKDLWFFPYHWTGETDFKQTQSSDFIQFLNERHLKPQHIPIPIITHSITRYKIRTQLFEMHMNENSVTALTSLNSYSSTKKTNNPNSIRRIEWQWMQANQNSVKQYLITSHANKIWRNYSKYKKDLPL